MEKNRVQAKEIINLKLEQESQAILLCEVTEQKKKAMEDKGKVEEDNFFFEQMTGREVNIAKQDFQHANWYYKSNYECQLWVKCQGHWDNYIEVVEWTIVEWPKKGKIIWWKSQQAKWSHKILWEIIEIP